MALSPAPDGILGVAALTRLIRESLEGDFPAVWVRGEVSGCKRADSGHLYFALKEGRQALIDCVMWRTSAIRLAFEPRDGVEVEAFGGITVYDPRGRYQLSVRELRPAGLGALLLALEELKRKLAAEGLFDPARKRPLPRYPRRVGLVTSPVGAAMRDMITVLRSRWPSAGIVLAPVRVQGPGAAESIAHAIRRFNRYRRVDVLIVGRGGGSLEDLWAFNEEGVVRAIASSRIPVISAVGHEVDWTLCDLVADARAATPSNAAEMAVPDRRDIVRLLGELRRRARRSTLHAVEERRRRLWRLTEKYGFRRQRDAVRPVRQRVDELSSRARGALGTMLRRVRERWRAVSGRYGLRTWPHGLVRRREWVDRLDERLEAQLARRLADRRARASGLADRLRALSPRMVLERGFCIVRRPDGSLVRSPVALAVGEIVSLEFARGDADARIERISPTEDHGTP